MTDWRREAQADPEDAAAAMRARLAEERRGAPGRFAVFGNVCSNVEALRAVLADMDAHGITRSVCLGALASRGPDPAACVDLILERGIPFLRSEADLLPGLEVPRGLNARVTTMLNWTAEQLRAGRSGLRALTDEAPRRLEAEGCIFDAHVPVRPPNPGREGEIITRHLDPRRSAALLGELGAVGFCAASQQAFGVDARLRLQEATGNAAPLTIACGPGEPLLVSVGGVGRSFDGDPRACWVEVQQRERDWRVTWHRVVYDIEAMLAKAAVVPALRVDAMEARRWREGW